MTATRLARLAVVPVVVVALAVCGDGDTDRTLGGVRFGFFAVHLEPGDPASGPSSGRMNLQRPGEYFGDLLALVDVADAYGHKLTLLFTAQWAAWITSGTTALPDDGDGDGTYGYQGAEYGDALSLVRAWEAHGHELGLHHHPFDAAGTWDGFSDDPSTRAARNYLGDMADFMSWVGRLPAGGAPALLSGTTQEWPPGPRHYAHGGHEAYASVTEPGHLVSRPCAVESGGRHLWRLNMRHYLSAPLQNVVRDIELPSAVADFSASQQAHVVGFVCHGKNVQETGVGPYTLLFEQLAERGLKLETVSTVIGHFDYTSVDPAVASPEHRCAE